MNNWEQIWCTCAGGLNHDGYECGTCKGYASYYRHKSGALAVYPGGPFIGHEPKEWMPNDGPSVGVHCT